MIILFLLMAAFLLFLISGLFPGPQPSIWYGRLFFFGLACWVLAEIIKQYPLTSR